MSSKRIKKNQLYFPGRPDKKKRTLLLDKTNAPLDLLAFEYRVLDKTKVWKQCYAFEESFLVLLKGACVVSVNGELLSMGPRKDVFSAKGHGLYLPAGQEFIICSRCNDTELVLVRGKAHDKKAGSVYITPRMVQSKTVGRGTYQRRVDTLFTKKSNHSNSHLLVGETYNKPGLWSSFPPHKHSCDRGAAETKYEEVYFFKTDPEGSFGIIRVYDDRQDECFSVKNNDCVVVGGGYHPVCAAPQTKLYYLWAMTGRRPSVVNAQDRIFTRAKK